MCIRDRLKSFPNFSTLVAEESPFYGLYSRHMAFFSTLFPIAVSAICITLIVLLINSSYGRAFKAIREDEIAAEAMGVNLFRHKQMSFCISSFFAGVGGALLAMFQTTVAAAQFKSALTYEILLIVVIGGIEMCIRDSNPTGGKLQDWSVMPLETIG